MATENGRADSPLNKELQDDTYRFEFFQAVRLLERILPRRTPVGQPGKPEQEVVRFRTRAALSFPPSQLYELKTNSTLSAEASAADAPSELTVSFMGLTGPQGVLPTHYTEKVIAQNSQKKFALWEFFDLFSHRMISLFYRAWEKSRFPIAWERAQWRRRRKLALSPTEQALLHEPLDQFSESLFALIGLGMTPLKQRLGLPDGGSWLLCYSGLIAQRPHSAKVIEAILSDYFAVPVVIEQFCGQWLTIEKDSRAEMIPSKPLRLGLNTVIGDSVWDSQSKFRLRIGPLTFHQFSAFLPTGSAWQSMLELTQFLAGPEFDIDAQLVLQAEEVGHCALRERDGEWPSLGWTTWLIDDVPDNDYAEVILSPESGEIRQHLEAQVACA